MFKKGLFLTVIFLLIFSISGFATDYRYTQESGTGFFVASPDKADALEDTNEIRQIVEDLGTLLVHSKLDGSYPKDLTTGGTLAIPNSALVSFATGTKGDIWYSSATNTWTKLNVGSDNKILVVATDVPNWETASSDLLSDVNSIGMLDEAETVTGNWVNTDFPWADNEVADILTVGSGSVLAAVTMTLGSDADNDIYYRSSNVLTRLASNSNADNRFLRTISSGAPSYELLVEADISDLGTAAALVADKLSVFSATTSAELAGVISDDTGTGALVFGTSPTITTPTIVFSVSQYPPAQSDTYVKSTTKCNTSFWAYYATDPTKSLTGTAPANAWLSASGTVANQRFHIDLGSAKIVKRIYYENNHTEGSDTDVGIQNFTFWGSNTAGDFADLVYANDGTWVSITTVPTAFDEHTGSDVADPKHITVDNAVAYRYYALKFVDNHGDATYIGVRRIELQTSSVTLKLSDFALTTSAELATVITNETGSGSLVFATSPTLVTPALGTPSAVVLTNATGTATSLTAGIATDVTITANNSTNENNLIAFVEDADVDGGNLGLETDTSLFYNPNTGLMTVPALNLTTALAGTEGGTGKATITDESFLKGGAGNTYEERTISEVKTDLAYQLSDLSDVNTSTVTDKFVLVADGVDFESRALVEADISDLGTYLENVTGESIFDLSDVTADPNADKYPKWDDDPGEIVWVDVPGGYTNLTSFVDQTAWRLFYSNTDGDVIELALGDDGKYLMSNGAAIAPTFETPAGAGDMLKATYDAGEDGIIDAAAGGTGVANAATETITLAGNDPITFTTTNTTDVTLPTTGTLMANLEEDTDPDLGGQLQAGAHSINFTEQILSSGTAVAWDLGNSNKATLTAAHNFTITITAPSGALNAQVIITQDGTGTRVMDEIITQADATIATTDVHADTEIIDITIDIPTGARIRFDNDVGTDVPEPLVENTIYYAIREDATHIKVATTKANAIAGTEIDITDQGTNVHTVEQLVKWQGGTLGVLTTDAGADDIMSLTYKTADKQWYAVLNNNFY